MQDELSNVSFDGSNRSIEQEIIQKTERAAVRGADVVREHAPVDSGELRSDIHGVPHGDSMLDEE